MTDQATGSSSEPGSGRARWQQRLEDLERERDELRVKLHLAKADAKDEWVRLEEKMDRLRARIRSAGREADEAAADVGDAAKRLWDEVKEGFERIRKDIARPR